jgi:hypothetical protein
MSWLSHNLLQASVAVLDSLPVKLWLQPHPNEHEVAATNLPPTHPMHQCKPSIKKALG